MVTWQEKLRFVGMEAVDVRDDHHSQDGHHELITVKIQNQRGIGLVSFGEGKTRTDAIRNASYGVGIDWYSVERKITEMEWGKISHF